MTKYRRKKNFVKKGVQLSQICDLDVIIITYDRKQNKLDQFYTTPDFKIEHVNDLIERRVNKQNNLIRYRQVNASELHPNRNANINEEDIT